MFTVCAANAKNNDAFLCELKGAYRCAGNTSISISVLGDKYIELHSKDKYKKNLKGKRLKIFLIESGHFSCTGDKVTIIEGT